MNKFLTEAAMNGELDITTPFAIRAPEGTELLAAGSRLDETVIADIAAAGRQKQFKTSCLLRHGKVLSDLVRFANDAPYRFIFGGEDGVRSHLGQFDEVPIPEPLLAALDEFKQRDYYTYRHSLVVFALTSFLVEQCYPNSPAERNVLLIGPTHDVGKLIIPSEILLKKTPLTRQERRRLEFHPIAGFVILSYCLGDHRHPAAQVALNHHERSDGSGYPRGLGKVSPLVEMVAVCDVYDALISSRPYRKGDYDNRAALEELSAFAEKGALSRYSVQVLISRNRTGYPAADKIEVSTEQRGIRPETNCHAVTVDDEDVTP